MGEAVGSFMADLRLALRALRKSPAYTIPAVLTLALGIGASVAVFSLVHGILFRPLPFHDGDRLVSLLEQDGKGGLQLVSYPTFLDWREQTRDVFAGMAFLRGEAITVRGDDGPEHMRAGYASPGFFTTLAARFALGRGFTPAEEAGAGSVAVISYEFWQSRFSGAGDVIGRTLSTPDGSYRVVGVLAREAAYPAAWAVSVYLPVALLRPAGRYALERRDLHVDSRLLARLRPGVTPQRAAAALRTVARRIALAYPKEEGRILAGQVTPIRADTVGDVRRPLLILSLGAILVLLIACGNVANLSLARALGRAREMALRAALGASRARLVGYLLAESLMLSIAGGAIGVLAANAAVAALKTRASQSLPRLDAVAVDARALAFALALTLAVTLLVGIVPAFRAALLRPAAVLASGMRAGEDRRAGRLRAGLVALEVALSLVLLVGSSLLLRSFWRVTRAETGFDPQGVLAIRLFPPSPRYDSADAARALYTRLEEAVRAVPGVGAAALVNHVPIGGGWMPTPVVVPGRAVHHDEDFALYRTVSASYFRTMRTPILLGRDFDEHDMSAQAVSVIVNEDFAQFFLGGGSPLGRTITVHREAQGRPDFDRPFSAQVVGVVRDERAFSLDAPAAPAVYVPYTVNPWPNTFLVVRGGADAQHLVPALQRAILAVDPDLPIAGPDPQARFRPLDSYLSESVATRRLNTSALATFAAAALLLALVGVFGLVGFVVARRTREMGVRLALGSQPEQLRRMVVARALEPIAVGVAVGLGGSFAASRLLASMLYDVSAYDPLSFLLAVAAFTLAAAVAAWIPARRATRVDPVEALRAE